MRNKEWDSIPTSAKSDLLITSSNQSRPTTSSAHASKRMSTPDGVSLRDARCPKEHIASPRSREYYLESLRTRWRKRPRHALRRNFRLVNDQRRDTVTDLTRPESFICQNSSTRPFVRRRRQLKKEIYYCHFTTIKIFFLHKRKYVSFLGWYPLFQHKPKSSGWGKAMIKKGHHTPIAM